MTEFVFVIVLQVTAFGYSATIVPSDPKFHAVYESEADCRKAIPAVRRAVPIPSIATLNAVVCQKRELKK